LAFIDVFVPRLWRDDEKVSVLVIEARLSKEMDVTIRSITRWETGVNRIPKMAELSLGYLALKPGARKKH
jgi:hypothetical protein